MDTLSPALEAEVRAVAARETLRVLSGVADVSRRHQAHPAGEDPGAYVMRLYRAVLDGGPCLCESPTCPRVHGPNQATQCRLAQLAGSGRQGRNR